MPGPIRPDLVAPLRALQEPIPTVWERNDSAFSGVDGDECLERPFSAGRWLEGPTYFAAGRYVVFSDIPNNRMLTWHEGDGSVGLFRSPSGYAKVTPATGPAGW